MLSPQRLERLHGLLLEQQASLRQQMVGLNHASQEAYVGLSNHMAEDATSAFDQATAVSLRRSYEATLEQIEQALGRMMSGTYGVCQRCGDEIDFARLKAIPYADLCMDCQKMAEL